MNRDIETRVYVERVNFGNQVNIQLITDKFGERYVAAPAVIKEEVLTDGYAFTEPFVSFTARQAQELLEGLWAAGFRPNHGESSVAHVNAMKYHLEDMRRLVFENGNGVVALHDRLQGIVRHFETALPTSGNSQ